MENDSSSPYPYKSYNYNSSPNKQEHSTTLTQTTQTTTKTVNMALSAMSEFSEKLSEALLAHIYSEMVEDETEVSAEDFFEANMKIEGFKGVVLCALMKNHAIFSASSSSVAADEKKIKKKNTPATWHKAYMAANAPVSITHPISELIKTLTPSNKCYIKIPEGEYASYKDFLQAGMDAYENTVDTSKTVGSSWGIASVLHKIETEAET